MPELPEVETTVQALRPMCEGRVITDCVCKVPKLRHPLDPNLADRLLGQRIERIERRAKFFYFVLPEGYLLMHLGMSGKMHFQPPHAKHDHFCLWLDDAQPVTLNDARRFGMVQWMATLEGSTLKRLGVEPLSKDFTVPYVLERLGSKKRAIKTWLMDQVNVVGVGNIYASEALFMVGIHPTVAVGALKASEWAALIKAVQSVLSRAIQAGGTTLKDFSMDDDLGYFAQALQVYGREGQACHRCQTIIERMVQVGRSTFYCPQCQPLSGQASRTK